MTVDVFDLADRAEEAKRSCGASSSMTQAKLWNGR